MAINNPTNPRNPQLPMQQGVNLPTHEREEEIRKAEMQEEEIREIEEYLGLEDEDLSEEVIEMEDGSVVINYLPTDGPNQNPEFYANLAESFDEALLDVLANEYLDLIEVDKQSREDRDKQYEEGIRRTGLGKDAPGGATFDGASKVVHPVMAEACVDFAASSSRELLPPEGIVKTEIKGSADRNKQEVAERKADFLNWQLTEQVEEYRDEMEQLLTQLPLGGSQYFKWRFDQEQRRPVCEWVPIDNILLPYATTNFYSSQRVTEVQDITEDVFKQRVAQGIYRDIDASYISEIELDKQTASQKASNKVEGKQLPQKNVDGVRRVFEITCFLRLEDDNETQGARAPYILTIDESSGKVLALYRNWAFGDEKFTKLDWYVEYKFIPWRGAYAIGLPHLIGGLSAALTGALRALLDSAHINNSQTMLKLKGGRISGQSDRIEPTQVLEIEGAPGVDDVRKLAMPLPFNQPSSVLYNLLGWLTDAAKGVVTTAEEKISEANANMPVGTAQALIEQGAKVFSSIHARLHRSQAKSLQILSRINHWYLEEMDNQSGTEIEVRDFAANNDIRPVSDPNIFSETQRIAQAQAVLQMATNAPPGMYDLRAAHRRVLKQLKVPAIDEILPNPDGIKEANPALENVAMAMGRPAAAYPDQDHISHIKIHLAFANNPVYGGNPTIQMSFAPQALQHIKQHLTLHYLQSMRSYVAEATGGEDKLRLHEENPLSIEDQQALALASDMVDQDTQAIFQSLLPQIQQLAQKVQQMQEQMQQKAIAGDATAQALVQTQMAETQRKTQEFQAKLQAEMQRTQQEYQLKIAEFQRRVEELQTKYQTETAIDQQENNKDMALANINNASRERIAMINAQAQMSTEQQRLETQQNIAAQQALTDLEKQIREHGFQVEKTQFEKDADQVANFLQARKDQALEEMRHDRQIQQKQFDVQADMAKQTMQTRNQLIQQSVQQPFQPPTGE